MLSNNKHGFEQNDPYLTADEVETLFDRLAASSGRTRAEWDEDVVKLREIIANGEDHLSFMEAVAFNELSQTRKEHSSGCWYCKRILDVYTFSTNPQSE